MCGIAGFFSEKHLDDRQGIISKMSEQLKHRGPDKQDSCNISNTGISFIHTRLSIIDLSALANQPMVSFCGNYTISYNGEIYNHEEIRTFLKNELGFNNWKSTSDTETLLASISLIGLENTLAKVRGMFAFSLFDSLNNTIYLVRDRFGEKPLYWFKNDDLFLWASEIKAMLAFDKNLFYITKERVHEYLTYGYVKAPNSIFQNIYKVQPGKYLSFSITNNSIQQHSYFSVAALSKTAPENIADSTATLKNLLNTAVKGTMLSDVPLGSFLSGGVDSSLITSLMVANSSQPVNTFTLGFENSELDESKYAREVASHLGTQHHEVIMSHRDVTDRIPEILGIIDEPLADSSVVPTYLLSEFTSKKVKVALSGDGADEIFLGYNRYFKGIDLWKKMNKFPAVINRGIVAAINHVPNQVLEKAVQFAEGTKPGGSQKITDISKKLTTIKQLLSSKDIYDYNTNIRVKWNSGFLISPGQNGLDKSSLKSESDTAISVLSGFDQLYYLPDDILFKVDRSAMACSLETRSPFLNVDVVNFAVRLQQEKKILKGSGKIILKELLAEYLPQKMINRPKKGFGLPISEWLKTSLAPWVESLIYADTQAYQFIHREKVVQTWRDHLASKTDNSEKIWTIVCLILWLKKYNPRIETKN